MPASWFPFYLTPPSCKRESATPVNLIPIMNTPLKSIKEDANILELSQQKESSQQRTWRPVGPPMQRYPTGVPTTYIHSLNLSFSQPGSYNISVNLSGEVTMAPEAAAQASAMKTKAIKSVTDGSPSQRTTVPVPGPFAPVKEAPATLGTSEDDLICETAISNPFGGTGARSDSESFYGY